jgi:hypothetical protein
MIIVQDLWLAVVLSEYRWRDSRSVEDRVVTWGMLDSCWLEGVREWLKGSIHLRINAYTWVLFPP